MSPEALARLRRDLATWDAAKASQRPDPDPVVESLRSASFLSPVVSVCVPDLRALLDAYAAMEKERDEALAAGRTVVEAADEMRQQWAEIEEDMTNERDTAQAQVDAARALTEMFERLRQRDAGRSQRDGRGKGGAAMSDFPTCTDCARRNIETYGGRCWSCDRNAARAEGVAAERARVVANLRAMNPLIYPSARFLAGRYERGEHDKPVSRMICVGCQGKGGARLSPLSRTPTGGLCATSVAVVAVAVSTTRRARERRDEGGA